ncbi:BatD family protein [bacterium]|nr:BatD family protein [bacterium]
MRKIITLFFFLFILAGGFSEQFHIAIKTSVDKKVVKAGEYFTLKLTLETMGNLSSGSYSMPELPDMDWATIISTFNSTSSNIVNNNMETIFSISAKYKTKKAGKFTIPPVKISYNDLNTGQKLDLDSESIQMMVKKPGVPLSFIIILTILIIIVFILIIVIKNGNHANIGDVVEQDVKNYQRETKSRYEDLKNIQDLHIKFNKFEDAFRGFLLEKYQIMRNILRDEIKEIISKKEISEDVQETLSDILDFIYLTKYKGSTPNGPELDKWIEKLEYLSEK